MDPRIGGYAMIPRVERHAFALAALDWGSRVARVEMSMRARGASEAECQRYIRTQLEKFLLGSAATKLGLSPEITVQQLAASDDANVVPNLLARIRAPFRRLFSRGVS